MIFADQIKRYDRRLDLVDGHTALSADYTIGAAFDSEVDTRVRLRYRQVDFRLIPLCFLELPVGAGFCPSCGEPVAR